MPYSINRDAQEPKVAGNGILTFNQEARTNSLDDKNEASPTNLQLRVSSKRGAEDRLSGGHTRRLGDLRSQTQANLPSYSPLPEKDRADLKLPISPADIAETIEEHIDPPSPISEDDLKFLPIDDDQDTADSQSRDPFVICKDRNRVEIVPVKASSNSIRDNCTLCRKAFDRSKPASGYLDCLDWFHVACIRRYQEQVTSACPICNTISTHIFQPTLN